jgi:hypothetical protein
MVFPLDFAWRAGDHENSLDLDQTRLAVTAESGFGRLAHKHNSRVHRHSPIQILDVVVDQPDASGRDEMADGFWRIRAVDEQARLVQQLSIVR